MENSFPKSHVEALWAPWRVEYYYDAEHRDKRDFLTEAAQASDDAAHLVVARRKSCFLLMNKYPYSAGHLMAVPYKKTNEMADLSSDEILELWEVVAHAQNLLKKVVLAQGFNVGWNVGQAGGAGFDDHLHIHIVPRWAGDSNFIATIGETRIIPQALRPLYDRLVAVQQEGA